MSLKILISNDDGVYSEGIRVLNQELKQIASTTVVAPDRNRSGASNSLSLERPLKITNIDNNQEYFSVNGTPTDCVHLAVTGWLEELPDMVVSGINWGANLGDDVLYSGTVAAAMEGRFLGYPAMAVSLANVKNTADINVNSKYFITAAKVVIKLVSLIREHGLEKDTILNVNVPAVPYEELNGFEVTRCGSRHPAEPMVRSKDPRGNEIFWIGTAGQELDAGPGSDFYAIKNNKVSITPLKVDMTNHAKISSLSDWLQTHM